MRAELEEVAAKYGADEVIVVNILYDHQARRRSYELLAEAFARTEGRRWTPAGMRVAVVRGAAKDSSRSPGS